jgi:hypothetical protein
MKQGNVIDTHEQAGEFHGSHNFVTRTSLVSA